MVHHACAVTQNESNNWQARGSRTMIFFFLFCCFQKALVDFVVTFLGAVLLLGTPELLNDTPFLILLVFNWGVRDSNVSSWLIRGAISRTLNKLFTSR